MRHVAPVSPPPTAASARATAPHTATVLAAAMTAALGGVLLLGGCQSAGTATTAPVPIGTTGALPTPAGPTTGATAAEAALRELFTKRLVGLERGDLDEWLLGVKGAGVVAEQRRVFAGMRALQVADVVLDDVSQHGAAQQVAGTTQRQMQVRLSYQLAGFDTAPRRCAFELTVTGEPDSPGGLDITASRPGDRPQPWDLPDLQVRRSATVLVAASGSARQADQLAEEAIAAAHRVAQVLGVSRPAVIVAPPTDELAAALLGRAPGDLAQVSAVTDGPLDDGSPNDGSLNGGLPDNGSPNGGSFNGGSFNGGASAHPGSSAADSRRGTRAGADRVVIVPGVWSSLSTAGQQVVLAHELTHVTTRAEGASGAVPLWLSEGLAEYVAYQGVPLPEAAIVRPALDAVHRTGLPSGWPDDNQFGADSDSLSAAYGLALLACRSVADRHGQAALVRFYRGAANGSLEAAFREIGADAAAERRAWQARIRALLGPSGQP